jgi:hypothetical protein
MSIALFRERLAKSRLHPDDIKWMPRWLQEFARSQNLFKHFERACGCFIIRFRPRMPMPVGLLD